MCRHLADLHEFQADQERYLNPTNLSVESISIGAEHTFNRYILGHVNFIKTGLLTFIIAWKVLKRVV